MGAHAGPEDHDRALLARESLGETELCPGTHLLEREIAQRLSKLLFFLFVLQVHLDSNIVI